MELSLNKMEQIRKNLRNELLKRKEIEIVIERVSNPGFENSKRLIVEKFKAPAENIVIKNVKSEFGRREFVIDAFIYDSQDILKKIEPTKKGGNSEEKVVQEVQEQKSVIEKKKEEVKE